MLKQEMEKLLGRDVTDQEYESCNELYMAVPFSQAEVVLEWEASRLQNRKCLPYLLVEVLKTRDARDMLEVEHRRLSDENEEKRLTIERMNREISIYHYKEHHLHRNDLAYVLNRMLRDTEKLHRELRESEQHLSDLLTELNNVNLKYQIQLFVDLESKYGDGELTAFKIEADRALNPNEKKKVRDLLTSVKDEEDNSEQGDTSEA